MTAATSSYVALRSVQGYTVIACLPHSMEDETKGPLPLKQLNILAWMGYDHL